MRKAVDMAHKYRNILQYRLVIILLSFSLILAFLLALIKTYKDYQGIPLATVNEIEKIQKRNLPILAEQLWKMEDHDIGLQLQGMLQHPVIEYIEVSNGDEIISSAGAIKSQRIVQREFSLLRNERNEEFYLGTISITAGMDEEYGRMRTAMLRTLLYDCFEMIIISSFFFLVVQHFLIKHLLVIARHVAELTPFVDKNTLVLQRGRWHKNYDELDHVVSAVNTMSLNLHGTVQEMKREVFERKKAESESERERVRAGLYFDRAEVMLAVVDQSAAVIRINPRGCEILGYELQEILGKDWFATFLPETIREEKRRGFVDTIHGESGIAAFTETRVLRKNGEERILALYSSFFRDEQNDSAWILFSGEDITQRKLLDSELLSERLLLQEIFESISEGIVVCDSKGLVTRFNQATRELYGLPDMSINADSLAEYFDLYMPDGKEPMQYQDTPLCRALAGERVDNVEVMVVPEEGPVRILLTNGRTLKDSSDCIVGAVVTMHDLTARKNSEKELERYRDQLEDQVLKRTLDLDETQTALLNLLDDMNLAKEELEKVNERLQGLDRMKSMFIASMSHELRTPLNSIIGFSSILFDEWLGSLNDEQKLNMASILRSGKHLLSLINDIIDISKIEAGTLEPAIDSFDLADLFREAVDSIKQTALDKGLDLVSNEFSYPMQTDRRRLLQVLINLLSNGVKFTDKGRIEMSAALSTDQTQIEIMVADTGIGIKEEDTKKLFQPFIRLHDAGSSVYPGTGLGLYLCRKITTEILHGSVHMKSIAGQGSEFHVILPVRIEK